MNLTPRQTRTLRTLVDAVLACELAAQDLLAARTLRARLRLNLARRRKQAAITCAFRFGLRAERAYPVGEWKVCLYSDGTALLMDEEDVDTTNRRATLQEANELLEEHGLRLWPTSDDYLLAVLMDGTGGRYLATALLGDDGRVELLRLEGGTAALTAYLTCDEAPDEPPMLMCNPRVVRAAQAFEFRTPARQYAPED
jgi:hypothetical protein